MRVTTPSVRHIRAAVFRSMLSAAERFDPQFVRLIEIRVLRGLAVRAFGTEQPSGAEHAIDAGAEIALASYAGFTAACAKEYAMTGHDPDLSRPYEKSYKLGSLIRLITGFRERRDTDRLISYLYRNININMNWITETELVVHGCYFSKYYSPDECRIMSDFDSGVIAGILGGGKVFFTERITEGCGRCKACWKGGTK